MAVSGWGWFTGLGQGSWMLGLAALVVICLGVALYEGHGDSGTNPCQRAEPLVGSVMGLDGQRSLTSSQVDQLHADSTQLAALAQDSAGETKTALEYAARMSASAQQGQPFDAGFTQGKFDSACSFSRTGGGGGNRGSVG
jgi:hypothetical protein